jgi:microcystin-dependent protein
MTANSDSPDFGQRLRELEEKVYNLQRERSDVETTNDNVKTGTIAGSLTAAVPQGWLLLNGQTITAAAWPALALYLTSNGLSLTLPDLRDRFPVGAGGTYAAGATGGSADAVVVAHTHPGFDHNHGIDANHSGVESAGFGLTASVSFADRVLVTGTGSDITTGTDGAAYTTGSSGATGTDANLPPYLGFYWMIRT